jgi:hypothetical protein
MERAMTDKRNTSDAREKDLRDAHLGQNEAAEEKEGKEKMSHMGRSGAAAEPKKKKTGNSNKKVN